MPTTIPDPAAAVTAAQALSNSHNYDPTDGGVTKCNLYLNAFVSDATLWNYGGFMDPGGNALDANSIVGVITGGGWTVLLDSAAGSKSGAPWDALLQQAVNLANAGNLVVFGLQVPGGRGHVAACLTGSTVGSGNWSANGLANAVPSSICQAGQDVFPPPIKGLSYGFTAADVNANRFVIAYLGSVALKRHS